MKPDPHRFCVAPMIDWTDRHCRYFHRILSPDARLYSEMIVASAILRGDADYLLGFHAAEHPLVLQLGGSDPKQLAAAARIGTEFGYDEINLNVGCPSGKVQSGRFGACLMAEPELVAECLSAMQGAVSVPVTVKHRLGIDEQDTGARLDRFVAAQQRAGCQTLIVHARKAWLKGLDPKQNREIPPLDHQRVYALKRDFSELNIVLNGGIENLEAAKAHLDHLDGVMLGRAAYQNPYLLAGVGGSLFGSATPPISRRAAVEAMLDYMEDHLAAGGRLHHITRHMLGLYHGRPGARIWRQRLSVGAGGKDAGAEFVRAAMQEVEAAGARAAAE